MANPARDTTAGRIYNDLRNLARRNGRSTDEIMIECVLERFLVRSCFRRSEQMQRSRCSHPVLHGPQASALPLRSPASDLALHAPAQPPADPMLTQFVETTQARPRSRLTNPSLTPLTPVSAAARATAATAAARREAARLGRRRHSGRLFAALALRCIDVQQREQVGRDDPVGVAQAEDRTRIPAALGEVVPRGPAEGQRTVRRLQVHGRRQPEQLLTRQPTGRIVALDDHRGSVPREAIRHLPPGKRRRRR